MSRRHQLLFLCQTLPYPPHSGVQSRTFNVLRLLARTFDITALCFYRWKPGDVQQDIQASVTTLKEWADAEAFPIPHEHDRLRFVWDHLRSVLLRKVYTAFEYDSTHYETRLQESLAANSFDLVHMDSLDLARYIPTLRPTPVVCVHHNVESLLLRRRASAEASPWRRAYLRYQAQLMKRAERFWCPRVALNVAVSETDREILERLADGGTFTVVPNGVDVDFYQPTKGRESGIVFVGGMTWFPNRDALQYFCDAILPYIDSDPLTHPVRWVGRASSSERQWFSKRYGVDMTGYVEDTRPIVGDAACYVVPLRVGGGTRLKILDAWAMGKALVSTSIGCEGLRAVDGWNILVRDDPEEFARAVQAVLSDEQLREELGRNARRTAEEHYSWEVIGKRMIRSYQDLVVNGS